MKRSFIKGGILVFATMLLTPVTYSFADDGGASARERARQEKICRQKQQQRANQYPYQQYTDGIAFFNQDDGVQKCLKWLTRASFCHPKRSPEIEHALYDIGVMGRTMSSYTNEDYSPTGKGIPNLSLFTNINEKINTGTRAIAWCGELPEPPPPIDYGK